VDRAGNSALLPLVALAHVDQERRAVGLQQLARTRGVDLLDGGLGSLQQLAVARHAFDCIASTASGRKRGSYRRRMSSPGRIFALVALSAVVASGVVVVGVLATRDDVPPTPKARQGHAPLTLDLGVRTDAEARALREAQRLYAARRYTAAGAIFRRDGSLEAQVGAALAEQPAAAAARMQQLRAEHPQSSLVALHFGLALYWLRRNDEALAAWRAAARHQPDTPYAVRAEDFLHPQYAPGLPRFVPSFPMPLRLRVLPPSQQLAALRRAAASGGAREKILYGVALQQLDRPRSAERQFAAAARLAPDDPDARVAAAVGLFDKGRPARAFGRLGPLTRTFPHAQTVRFHLGLLLLWSAQVAEARKQLTQARAEGPRTRLGEQAMQYLRALRRLGTN
jgi:tetratricopeptide (TPR) repeat protein